MVSTLRWLLLHNILTFRNDVMLLYYAVRRACVFYFT